MRGREDRGNVRGGVSGGKKARFSRARVGDALARIVICIVLAISWEAASAISEK